MQTGDTPKHTLINGISAEYLSVDDRGLHYGDGLFETIKLQDGKLCYWREHYQRLQRSAHTLQIACPPQSIFEQDIRSLLQTGASDAVIKIILTRGSGERGYAISKTSQPTRIVQLGAMPQYDEQFYQPGIRAGFCQHRLSTNPALAGVKHLNRLDNVLARNTLGKGCQEGIMLDQQGRVIEGCMSNLFFIKQGVLHTPALRDAGVDGVIRQQVLALANAAGWSCRINDVTPQDVLTADEIFFSNSLIGLWPVRQLDDITLASIAHCQQLAAQLARHEKDHATSL